MKTGDGEGVRSRIIQKEYSWWTLIPLTLSLLWAVHAIVFFAHEYAHSFTAWILGWKLNPFALNYSHATLRVFLLQLGISQNVNEVPIFASGHRGQAGAISLAGALVGNALITLPLSRWLYCFALARAAAGWALLAYWMTVASIGNFIDYVPVRTFITGHDLDQDMYAVEQGFRWSPWTLLIILGLPTALVIGYFFLKMEPRTLSWIFPKTRAKRVFMTALTAFVLFDFYGAAGWSDGGAVAHVMSVVSVICVAPIAAALTGLFSATGHDAAAT